MLGLLHADLDAFGSDYAPVRSSELAGTGYRGWFLGHVHKPGEVAEDGTPFYLGSVTGLNPGETGLHGPVLVEVNGPGSLTAKRLPLAPLRWEHLDVDCTGLEDPVAQLERHLLGHLVGFHRDHEAELGEVRALGVRVTLTGRVTDPATVERSLRDLGVLNTALGDTVLFVQKITNRLTARIDLEQVAQRSDPPGLLARRVLALERHPGDIPGVPDRSALVSELLTEARRHLVRVDSNPAFKDLVPVTRAPTETEIRTSLLQAARLALAEMLSQVDSQKEAGHASG
jgi:DNA repair exonuclease SbcCD nuclease subunit